MVPSSSSSSPNTPYLNNYSRPKSRRSIRSLVPHLEAKRRISQPNPQDTTINAAFTDASTSAASTSTTTTTSRSTTTTTTTTTNDDYGGAPAIYKLIEQDLTFLKEAVEKVKDYVGDVDRQINQASDKFEELKRKGSERELDELKRTVIKLKTRMVSNLKVPSADRKSTNSSNQVDENEAQDALMLNMYADLEFEHTTNFEQFKVSFLGIPFHFKGCLLCFLMFPENAIIKKRTLVYWWIGGGILPPSPMYRKTEEEIAKGKTAEDFGNEVFDKLIAKGFIEPVCTKSRLFADSCWMRPFVRSALNALFESGGFSLDDLRCWLNVDESFIDDGPELFLEKNHTKILYLGRWHRSATHHIEVTNANIFDGLKNMNHLTFLSLRGISMITELPEFISQHINPKILDLRACHNLEVVPDRIGLLKSLTHLDMSECYFIDHMPKGLASLSELEVLKGFVIAAGTSKDKKSCTLEDLAKLPKLRKLNVYTSVKEFPTERQLRAFQKFEVLSKLTISWGGCSTDKNEAEPTTAAAATRSASLTRDSSFAVPFKLEKLEKLDLQCLPSTSTPSWLRPVNLVNLKKLYIKGGKLGDLSQLPGPEEQGRETEKVEQWAVEILRLKHLHQLKMDWTKLQISFPDLICSEVIDCQYVNGFPGEKNGVWMKSTNK